MGRHKNTLQAPDALEQVLDPSRQQPSEAMPPQVAETSVEPRNLNTLPHIRARLEEAEGLLWRMNLYFLRERPPCQYLGEWRHERASVAHEVRTMFGEVQS